MKKIPTTPTILRFCLSKMVMPGCIRWPDDFEAIALKLLDSATRTKSYVVFSTDSYRDESIKELLTGEKQKRTETLKEFLTNPDNKKQLSEILLRVWQSKKVAARLMDKIIIYIHQGQCWKLTSDGENIFSSRMQQFYSDQEETETQG